MKHSRRSLGCKRLGAAATAMLAGFSLLATALPLWAQTTGDVPPARLGPTEPPAAAQSEIADVSRRLDEVDSFLLQGDKQQARAGLDEAEDRIKNVTGQHGASLPPGYVPLFVVEERLAALRRQLGEP
jgi:hypothetical protein